MIACELNIFFYTPVKQNTYTMSSCNVKQKEDQKSTYTLYIHSERDMHYVWLSKEIRSIDGVTRIALERTKLESTMHKDTNHIIDLVKTLKNLSLQPLEKKTINMGKHDKENILLERPCAPYKHPDSNIVFKNCDCKGISNSLLINGMPIPEFPQIRHF